MFASKSWGRRRWLCCKAPLRGHTAYARVSKGSTIAMVPETSTSLIQTLHPAYFALVMATGIVSIAAQLMGIPFVPRALLVINVVAYALLWGLTIARIARFPRDVFADVANHQRGVGFFTIVAATSVLGSQLVIVLKSYQLAFALWVFTLALWLVLIYAIFSWSSLDSGAMSTNASLSRTTRSTGARFFRWGCIPCARLVWRRRRACRRSSSYPACS